MSTGSLLFGKSFGNVFVWSKCVNARILLICSFLIKYNFGVFDEMSIMEFLMKININYGVSDKIIPTMNKIMKAIKYNVNIAMC